MARLPMVTGFVFLVLIHVTMSISVQEFFPDIKNNLTKIKWTHATNSKLLLEEALASSEIMMIEADVTVGYVKSSNGAQPTVQVAIMAHPPNNSSDLSLSDFLLRILTHNDNKENKTKKGIKLDFKSADAIKMSEPAIGQHVKAETPIWLNADVLKGPLTTPNDPMPVPAQELFNFTQSVAVASLKPLLSIGWTTGYVAPAGNATTSGNYTIQQIDDMLKLVNETANPNLNVSITYPVRACYAADSIEVLKTLLAKTPVKNNATLTIWSGKDDVVDTNKLSQLIRTIGVDKVFVDVPKSIFDKLNVNSAFATNSSVFVVFASMIIALFSAKIL